MVFIPRVCTAQDSPDKHDSRGGQNSRAIRSFSNDAYEFCVWNYCPDYRNVLSADAPPTGGDATDKEMICLKKIVDCLDQALWKANVDITLNKKMQDEIITEIRNGMNARRRTELQTVSYPVSASRSGNCNNDNTDKEIVGSLNTTMSETNRELSNIAKEIHAMSGGINELKTINKTLANHDYFTYPIYFLGIVLLLFLACSCLKISCVRSKKNDPNNNKLPAEEPKKPDCNISVCVTNNK